MRGIDRLLLRNCKFSFRLPRMRGSTLEYKLLTSGCRLPACADRPQVLIIWVGRGEFTPHARGSTRSTKARILRSSVYPACAGIDRSSITPTNSRASLPRMRGDRPELLPSKGTYYVFTPHARGSTLFRSSDPYLPLVYPACAGIDLAFTASAYSPSSLPRMRGDRPDLHLWPGYDPLFTPHARGSTLQKTLARYCKPVYPACAGIDLSAVSAYESAIGLPRMRGDRPGAFWRYPDGQMFTPHARGSTLRACRLCLKRRVYPACAGIDRIGLSCNYHKWCLPRMRGDRPQSDQDWSADRWFTACAGIDHGWANRFTAAVTRMRIDPLLPFRLLGLPHARIDPTKPVSYLIVRLPRMRGSTSDTAPSGVGVYRMRGSTAVEYIEGALAGFRMRGIDLFRRANHNMAMHPHARIDLLWCR